MEHYDNMFNPWFCGVEHVFVPFAIMRGEEIRLCMSSTAKRGGFLLKFMAAHQHAVNDDVSGYFLFADIHHQRASACELASLAEIFILF